MNPCCYVSSCSSKRISRLLPLKRRIVSSTLNRCISSSSSSTSFLYNNTASATPVSIHHPYKQHGLNTCQRRWKVFVSKHNQSLQISMNQIIDFCTRHLGIHHNPNNNSSANNSPQIRTTATHVILRECTFCSKPTLDKPDNLFKLYIQIGGGAYFCHRCGAKGSWFDFTQKLGSFEVHDNCLINDAGLEATHHSTTIPYKSTSTAPYSSLNNTSSNNNSPTPCLPMPQPILQKLYTSNLLDPLPSSSLETYTNNTTTPPNHHDIFGNRTLALDYLIKTRGLTRKTLRVYGVGLTIQKFPSNNNNTNTDSTSLSSSQNHRHMIHYVKTNCITFPWIMRASDIHEQESLRGSMYVWKKENQQQHEVLCKNEDGDVEQGLNEDTFESENKNLLDATTTTSSTPYKEDVSKSSIHPPMNNPFVVRRIKLRSIDNKAWQRLDPPGGGWSLFGLHTVPLDAKEIVLTEGEYDAMAVYQATGRPSVSLPNGCRSLPDAVLPLLERFDKIYLWMDNDGPGREGAEQFAKKLGLNRCYLVQPTTKNGKPTPKDANEALLQNYDLEQMILDARLMPHHRILTFAAVRDQVLEEILNPNKYSGIQVPSLPILNSIIKGFRRGEMTVVTGPTGSGKTTFLGQLSLDFAEQGHSTLWGSFEIKNTRLLHKLMQQFSREPLVVEGADSVNYLNALADRFENLPLYFMKFHGGSDVDDVLDAMDYAAYVHDVQHIILDNLQFMISRNSSGSRSSFDKFDYQDMAIEKFRKFATEKNVHVTVVVHPRKEDEYSKLGISSIFGSAKATQEADSVLILQYDGQRKYIEVKKNRFDGTLGYCELHFQRKSCRYSDQPEPGKTLTIPNKTLLKPPIRQITGIGGAQSIKERTDAFLKQSLLNQPPKY